MAKKHEAGPRPWVDPDDAPELTEALMARADVWQGDKLVRRGRGRPPSATPKQQITIRLDKDVVAALRAGGPRWQSRINDTLRDALHLKKAG